MKRYFSLLLSFVMVSQSSFAKSASDIVTFSNTSSTEPVEIVNWYYVILAKVLSVFMPNASAEFILHKAETWSPVLASVFCLLFIVLISKFSGLSKLNPEKLSDEELLPPKKFGFKAMIDMGWSVVQSTLESTIGEKYWAQFVSVLGGTFFLLLISNLSGVFPGFEPATASMSFTFAGSIIIFLYFNFYGFKEAGFDYVKHLAGPVIWIAPAMFVIELVSVLARPVSLSLRIFGNVSGDHFVFSIFSNLMKTMSVPFLPIPAIFLAFGTFVACVQAFIFMTLSAVYIKLALDSKAH